MGEWDGIEFEMYDEDVMEYCERCLRLRITLRTWVHPSPDMLNVFTQAKPIHLKTLCHRCLREIMALKSKDEKVILKLCKCQNAFHNEKKIWFKLNKSQIDYVNLMLKEGRVEVLRIICPICRKGGEKNE